MTTQAYRIWHTAGEPYSVARPVLELVNDARANGVEIKGVLGNLAHLQSDFPEDHTPFSFTPWPWELPGYIVTACDLASGDWCWTFLDRCKKGIYPWVKYINFFGWNYSVKRGWVGVKNSDDHFHCSVRTDYLNSAMGVSPWKPLYIPDASRVRSTEMLFFYCANADGGTDTAGDERWAVVTGDGRWKEFATQEDADNLADALGPTDDEGRSARQCSPASWARLKAEFSS